MIRMKAPAKVNLVLEITGKRRDGYHNISSIMQTIDLYDKLSFDYSPDLGFHCDEKEIDVASNLVLRAAHAIKQRCGYKGGAVITLEKKIPWNAGLGGGSSDAAVTLMALNKLWSAGFSRAELVRMSLDIGSDIAFFMYGGTCLVEGRGDVIKELPDMQRKWFILVHPAVNVPEAKTASLYKMAGSQQFTDGNYCTASQDVLNSTGGIEGKSLYNAFESVAFKAYEGLQVSWDIFKQTVKGSVHLAGAGPVLFAMVDDKDTAYAIADNLRAFDLKVFVASSLARNEIGYR